MEHDKDQCDPQVARRLADDELANVLRRLAPRWLAASRRVCKAWQTLIDDRRLLRADLLPLSLSGIFVHLEGHRLAELFSRPSSSSTSTGPAISANFLDFLPTTLTPSSTPYANGDSDDYRIIDHCNGLLLLEKYVVNPATRRWAPLPPCPSKHPMATTVFHEEYIVFDPTVSLHYEVFSIPGVDRRRCDAGSEWPPPVCVMHCFSSRTGRWEERSFVRQGEAVPVGAAAADMGLVMGRDHAAYWRGALYVHWEDNFFMRIQLSNQEYRVTRAPTGMSCARHLGRSEKGVYLASVSGERLRVWILLHEPDGEMRWILKDDTDIKAMLARQTLDCQASGPWFLEDFNYRYFSKQVNEKILRSRRPSLPEIKDRNDFKGKFEWNSDGDDDDDDNDDLLDNGDTVEQCYRGQIDILGFHPYKEIVFLSSTKEHQTLGTGLSYHLGSSKLQVLGNLCPAAYSYFNTSLPNDWWSFQTFPYTPCWIDEFPLNI